MIDDVTSIELAVALGGAQHKQPRPLHTPKARIHSVFLSLLTAGGRDLA
jgi:hypothetical protein